MVQACLKHGDDVFRRNFRLNVVYRIEHIAAALTEDIDHPVGFRSDFFDGTVRQNLLGVEAAPESHTLTELALETFGFHVLRCYLHRIKSVDTDVDQMIDEVVGAAAAMEKRQAAGQRLG